MEIIKKLSEKSKNIYENSPVTMAFLGDSVTQGCFDVYIKSCGGLETYFDSEKAYHSYLKKILNMLYPNVPLTIINAGLSGGSAEQGLNRLERDVLRYSPDLCVVCFGLNDSCGDNFDKYISSLKEIFIKLKENNCEVIFLTPNMMCTEVSCHIKDEKISNIAKSISEVQNNGTLEKFLNGAKELAKSMNIPVCDCYSKWKKLYDSGVNTTELLSNHINHPIPEMNKLFAYSLIETMFN